MNSNGKPHPSQLLNEAVVRATGKRWCGGHQGHVPSDQGEMQQRGKVKRFVCNTCLKNQRKQNGKG